MLKWIAIALTISALMLVDRVHEPWALVIGVLACGVALGLADEHGERRVR